MEMKGERECALKYLCQLLENVTQCALIVSAPQPLTSVSPPSSLHCFSTLPTEFCVTLLLWGVRPALKCGQSSKGHTITQRWLFFSWKLTIANSSSARMWFRAYLPLSGLGFCLAEACLRSCLHHHNSREFICAMALLWEDMILMIF